MDAVVEAARQIVADEGYDALTTNRVAKLAGVSIGSLYRYFADRDAIVAELARRIERRTLELAASRANEIADPAALADAMIELVASTRLGDLRTRNTILQRIPRIWTEEVSQEVDDTVVHMVQRSLEASAQSFRDVGDPAVSAFMLMTAVEAVVEQCVTRHPEWIESGALRMHLQMLVRRYLGLDDPAHDELRAADDSSSGVHVSHRGDDTSAGGSRDAASED